MTTARKLALHDPERPAEHIRNALALLSDLQGQIIELGVLLGPASDYRIYGLLRVLGAADGRLWRAVAQLEGHT